jgi:hypothetical protein
MTAKLAGQAPAALLALVDKMVEPLEKALTARLKSDAVKQEVGGWLLWGCGGCKASQRGGNWHVLVRG